ncbi:hypothetical protein OHA77_33545 [Streptosporangium sp. NBC_01639]|uniref:hypothetical protein n=1 Tax=Streptosporangium sp. NBC_01639 TaxID=2975948 RepID=UPI00386DDDB0|nr:hypothetical protein OHA77_33545 [Streptosporangium sp. NBC_01639]
MQLLRQALSDRDIPTLDTDVMVMRSGHPTLSIAQGVLVWCGPERFRWPSETGLWSWHPVCDPEGAAVRLAAQLDKDPVLQLRRAFPWWTILRFAGTDRFCAAPASADLSGAPAVEAGTPEALAALLRAVEPSS